MTWDDAYRTDQRVWGDKPSELATFVCRHLQGIKYAGKTIDILDLGCGYGRDAIYLANNINCRVLGIDNSSEAIEMARKALPADLESLVTFQCCDFKQMADEKFEVVLASNFYHLLKVEERLIFRNTIKMRMMPSGMLFLSMLSTGDPEHFGQGQPVEDDINSFQDKRFLHFCTREELESDFSFLTIEELVEHEYYEPRSNGEVHHHILWILLALKR
ncbi:MAG: methyltransferase domain-containing protein [Dehalococcoidia bacterium]|nr:methyltransferase domain-containing protein [Dehalococcoidia bacterium]